jgi:Fic family protein
MRHFDLAMARPSTSFVEQQQIERVLDSAASPLAVEVLAQRLAPLTRRTLQRRLAELVRQGRVLRTGGGRGARYSLPPVLVHRIEQPIAPFGEQSSIPLSAEAKQLQRDIRQPAQQRKPVGYRIEFLEAYHPNRTAYLPAALREQLRLLGRAPTQDAAAGTFARDIFNRLLIDLSWASSQLEGNTYSRLDTQRLIEHGQAATGKDALETQMILNHKAAIEYLVLGAERIAVDAPTLIALHALLSDGLLADSSAVGRLRQRTVEIGGSVYRPLALPQQVAELFNIVVEMAAEIDDPFEQAFFLMVHLPYLQPFEDVNKRVSRLAANIPLLRRNLCPLSFIDVPPQAYVDAMLAVYELNRVELLRDLFVWAYERSCQQYNAVRQQLVPPDSFRLRHRAALADAVRHLVQKRRRPTASAVKQAVPRSVPVAERERFVTLVQREFESLHAGNVVRFGLHPFEFESWQKVQK